LSPRLADPARSRIVLIGTPVHRHAGERLPDVPAVANNITDLAAVFTDPELGGFDTGHCVTTPAGIGLDSLGQVLTEAASHAEDLLLIYYAGHGLLDRRGQLHLALADTHPDRLGFTALAYETLRAVCLDSDAAAKVVILDSCFSGRAIGQTLAGQDQQVLGQLDVAGTYTLTSAAANRTALILPGERHTAFTGRLLQLLHEGDPESGPVLSIGEIYRQLRSRLQADNLPLPQQRGTATADLLGLVRNHRRRPPTVAELPEEIRDGLDSRFSNIRLGAVNELAGWLTGPDPARALAARNALQRVIDHDNPVVAGAAAALLSTVNLAPALPTNPIRKVPVHAVPLDARGLAAEAERVAGTITDTDLKARALAGVVRVWTELEPAEVRRLATEAERVAGTITHAGVKVRALAEVVRVWTAVDPGEARRLAAEAERVARTTTETRSKVQELAKRVAGTSANTYVKAQALAEAARAWAELDPAKARGLAAEAERVARTTTNTPTGMKMLALVEVARAWAAVDPAEAERVAGTITHAGMKVRALVEVARAWAAVDPAEARRLAAEAERFAGTLGSDLPSMAQALAEVVPVWAAVEPAEARRLAAEVGRVASITGETYIMAQALAEVVPVWAAVDPAEARRLAAEAERVVGTAADTTISRKAQALAEVARAWAAVEPAEARRLAAEAERVASSITRDTISPLKALALADVVRALAAAAAAWT
jgi:hypothetical protein